MIACSIHAFSPGETITDQYIKADDGKLYRQPMRAIRSATYEEYINDMINDGLVPSVRDRVNRMNYYEIQVD